MANSDACDFDRFLIGTIMHLLEDHQPHHRVQFLGGPAMAVMIMPAQGLDGQLRENMLLKKTRPGTVQELSSLGSQMRPRIDDVELFVVFYVKHGAVSHCVDIA